MTLFFCISFVDISICLKVNYNSKTKDCLKFGMAFSCEQKQQCIDVFVVVVGLVLVFGLGTNI